MVKSPGIRYPSLRRRAEGFREADRHVGRHASATIHQIREGLATDAEDLRAFGDVEAERPRQDTRTILPGCGGFLMGVSVLPLFSGLMWYNID